MISCLHDHSSHLRYSFEVNFMMSDDIVLSYHNSLLRKSDVKLLNNPNWFNDQLIGFWFEFLEQNVANDSICLISPEVAHFIKLTGSPEEAAVFVAPLNLSSRTLTLLPVNDATSKVSNFTCENVNNKKKELTRRKLGTTRRNTLELTHI